MPWYIFLAISVTYGHFGVRSSGWYRIYIMSNFSFISAVTQKWQNKHRLLSSKTERKTMSLCHLCFFSNEFSFLGGKWKKSFGSLQPAGRDFFPSFLRKFIFFISFKHFILQIKGFLCVYFLQHCNIIWPLQDRNTDFWIKTNEPRDIALCVISQL